MIYRKIDIKSNIKEMSILLLGPRQTGKSTYLLNQLGQNVHIVDLLNPEIYRDLQKQPGLLSEFVAAQVAQGTSIICIDEIQKIPELLDVVHSLIEKHKKLRFLLTGSSARKLKMTGANLLGGRVLPMFMHPITSFEYLNENKNNNLKKLIQHGGLPSVITSDEPYRRLKAYVGIYLQEEIKAEGFVRNLNDFSKFLEVAALTNAEQLDYVAVASDAQISARTVAAYYQILQDTLVGYLLEPYRKTKTRKAVAKAKFYFFDVGVANHLTGREQLAEGTPEYGKAVEHFIFTELIAFKDYFEKDFKLYYWRSTSKFEVDFLIQNQKNEFIAIEVKATKKIDHGDFKGIKALEDDIKISRKIVVSLEPQARKTAEGFEIYPLAEFCSLLWAEKII